MKKNSRHPSANTPWRLLFVLGLVHLPITAHAYLDPGSGSLIFQSLLAVIFGVGVGVRAIRHFVAEGIRKILRRKRNHDAE